MERTHFTWLPYEFCPGIPWPPAAGSPFMPTVWVPQGAAGTLASPGCGGGGGVVLRGQRGILGLNFTWHGLVWGRAVCAGQCSMFVTRVVPWQPGSPSGTVVMAARPLLGGCGAHSPLASALWALLHRNPCSGNCWWASLAAHIPKNI